MISKRPSVSHILMILSLILFTHPCELAGGIFEANKRGGVPILLQLIPDLRLLVPGMERRFQALAVFADGSQKDVTMVAELSLKTIGAQGIIDISQERGLARGIAQGSATISASFKDVSGSTMVKVLTGVQPSLGNVVSILFLHHSTGSNIWQGGVSDWIDRYNATHKTDYTIVEQAFPKKKPYGWNNYPYDYWNIWVRNAGQTPYQEEPTLEMLTGQYQVIVFKHCYPVSNIRPETGKPDVSSDKKRMENYRVQYEALKSKMRSFPGTRFIIWTGPARVESAITREEAERARQFFEWMKIDWDEPGDNIFVWDFYELETEGGLFLRNEYAVNDRDSHPNRSFSQKAATLLGQRIVDVIQGIADQKSITGE